MNPYHRTNSRQKYSQESVHSEDFDNPFVTNESNRQERPLGPIFLGAHSFMRFSNPPTVTTSSLSPHSKISQSPTRSESIRIPFNPENQINRSKAGSILSLPPLGGETAFKSAIEEPLNENDQFINRPFFKEGFTGFHNDENVDEENKRFDDEKQVDEKQLIDHRHQNDAIDSKTFGMELHDDMKIEEESESQIKQNNKKKLIIVTSLMIMLIFSTIFSSLPVFTCNDSRRICVPQLTIQLTDKSPAAKTALLTVREALKVLSYLAIDFGDADNDVINTSLDSYYQNKVIDAFSVNTVYQLNFLGYCRLSTKDLEYFCMKSYGFDLLSVFVRDAGVQLGELTKTNLFIMGDSFAIAYELAINGFNKLVNKEGTNNDYIDWAILLQKFSKGLGFLSLSQFVFDSTLVGLLLILIFIIEVKVPRNTIRFEISKFIKKWSILIMTLLGFWGVMVSFLISSLTLEYTLKLNELATNVGIANVNTGFGFILIWISFASHIAVLILVILIANLYRKGLL